MVRCTNGISNASVSRIVYTHGYALLGVIMCTSMYFLLLVKLYWCKIVYYDVALSDCVIGDTNCTNISNVSQMYMQFYFDCYSSMSINFDTLNRVFVKSSDKKVSTNKCSQHLLHWCQK